MGRRETSTSSTADAPRSKSVRLQLSDPQLIAMGEVDCMYRCIRTSNYTAAHQLLNFGYTPQITTIRMRVMSKHLVLTVLFLCMSILGCSNGGGSSAPTPPTPPTSPTPPIPPTPPTPPVAPVDVAGTWFSRTANNAVNCDAGEFIDAQALVITQDDSAITLLTSTGNTFSGTVNGDIVEWTGSFDERGGTTTFTSLSVTVSGSSASGNADWTWTDGTDSCNGTMAITASRDWSMEETQRNSNPGIADPLEITDGVAFATGAAVSILDKDYFSFVMPTDATVQAELSHFDLLTNNFDLEILDENENQVALSNSIDGFEKAEAQFQAGDTFYIGVLPITGPGDASFILSIDVN